MEQQVWKRTVSESFLADSLQKAVFVPCKHFQVNLLRVERVQEIGSSFYTELGEAAPEMIHLFARPKTIQVTTASSRWNRNFVSRSHEAFLADFLGCKFC